MFQPLGSLLSIFYGFTNSYGFAIILLTVTVRLILFPLTAKQMRSMNAMAKAQPHIKKLQAEHGSDKQKLNEEMMKFYKQEGINPAAGCLPLLLQIPVFIGLFRVIRGLSSSGPLSWLGVRVAQPEYLSKDSEMYRSIVRSGGRLLSFGFDLAESANATRKLPYIALVVIYAVSGWVQQSMANKRNPAATSGPGAQMQQIMKVFPIFMGIFAWNMPAGLVLYWFASNLWTIGQQEILAKTIPRHVADDDDTPEVSLKKLGRADAGAKGGESASAGSVPAVSGKLAKAASGKSSATKVSSGKAPSQRPPSLPAPAPKDKNKAPVGGASSTNKNGPTRNIPPSAGKKRGR
jgi:YidC/Oxa1 family membrane protein insertase